MLVANLGCRVGTMSAMYLALPLGAPFKRINVWHLVVERIKKRLLKWKANYLSKGGRLTLIKAALANIPIYHMSLLNMPKHITNIIEKYQRNFLWQGRMESSGKHLVAWDFVCSPKA